MHNVGRLEHAFDAVAVEIREGRFVEQFRIHHPACREVVDDEVEEFQLIRGEPASVQEFGKGMFGRLAIEPDKSADQTWQPAVDLQRPERCFVNAGRKKDALKFLQVGRCQRLVSPDLEHRDVVLVRLEKHPRLAAEGFHVGADSSHSRASQASFSSSESWS